MLVMTYSQARQNFSYFLEIAKKEGQAIVKRADGTQFKVVPVLVEESNVSPFAKVIPVSLKEKITMDEIIDLLHESDEERADEILQAASGKSTADFFNSYKKA